MLRPTSAYRSVTMDWQVIAWLILIATLAGGAPQELWGQDRGILNYPKLKLDQDWPWWRGPNRDGSAVDQEVPIEFSEEKHLKWAAMVPGRGHSSPVVVGKVVYLTTADIANKSHSILAFDRSSGKLIWQKVVNSEGGFPARNHPKNTEATPTLASDGTRLFGTFFHHEGIHMVAMDLEGNVLWKREVGPFNPKMYEYGYAPSPLLYGSTVIVCGEYDGESFLAAVQAETGKDVWRIARPKSISFSSPVVAHVAGKDQLLISGVNKVSSYDPNTGNGLWEVDGTTFATCGTMVWEGDVVMASGGYPKKETLAVKADGSGKVLWRNDKKCYEQSMVVYRGHLYALTDDGIAFCWNIQDGKEMWKKRLKGPVSASPVRVKDRIYWANEAGTMYVFRASPDSFELLAENQIGEEGFASPAICGGEIFLRTAKGNREERQEVLYSFGK